MTATITARLLLASRLTYCIQPDGTLQPMPNQGDIGLTAAVQAFILGPNKIDAALFGVAADALILAFRGTIIVASPDPLSRIADWLNDADALLVAGNQLPGMVHKGFCDTLDALWPSLLPVLTAALTDPANAQKPLYVTGHSKGGAVAYLAAARIAKALVPTPPPFPERVQCVTFAAARPGDADFATSFDTLVPHAIRYEYQNDIVPHVPPGELLAKGIQALPKLSGVTLASDDAFESAGTLRFFDWSDAVETDSFELQVKRIARLLDCLASGSFDEIVADHSIDPGKGYANDVNALTS